MEREPRREMATVLTERKETSQDGPRVGGVPRARLLLMLPFLILFYVNLAHHQLWRDEINAWGLVVASHSIRALLSNVHYEVHPALWYLLLYPCSKLTHAPWMMKLVEAFVGTGIYLVLAFASPYKRAEQVLIYASFFVSFEYTVMSRMYGLMLLFTLVYVWARTKHPDRPAQNAFWLGMIANTDVTGMILSGGLLLEYWIDCWHHRKDRDGVSMAKLLSSAMVYGAMCVLSAATLWPAKDISWRTGRPFRYLHDGQHLMVAALNYLALPFFPAKNPAVGFWDARSAGHLLTLYILAPIVITILVMVFRRQPRFLVMIGSIAAIGVGFNHLVFDASLRHFGIMYVAFIAGIWMLRSRGSIIPAVAYALLGLNAVAGATSLYGQWARPFTDDDAAAAWLVQNHLENAVLIGTPDTGVVGVPERLQRPMYFLDCGCWDTYMKFSSRRDKFDYRYDLPPTLIKAIHELHAPTMVLILNRVPTDDEEQQLEAGAVKVVPLAQFTRGELWDEHFFLYRVTAD
jgi:hypothetical protein